MRSSGFVPRISQRRRAWCCRRPLPVDARQALRRRGRRRTAFVRAKQQDRVAIATFATSPVMLTGSPRSLQTPTARSAR